MRNRKHYLFFLLISCFVGSSLQADPISKALKLLRKGKHAKVESVLKKSQRKHPVNAGAHYVWSKLYYDSTFLRTQLDSAHYHIEEALNQQQITDSLEGWPLEKAKLARIDLLVQKHQVDSSAFTRSVRQNTVGDFQYFIDYYTTAPQLAKAIELRNQLAFQEASDLDTYQSYLAFMQRYPKSEQYAQAEQRYHLLLFQSMTSGGRLEDYLTFLQENPQSPYRPRAEEQIFQLQTLKHDLTDYQDFLNSFPQSKAATRARSIVQYFNDGAQDLEVTKSLTAVYQDGHYGFMDQNGHLVVPAVYDSIPEQFLCEPLLSNIIPIYDQGHWQIVDLKGQKVWDQPYEQIEELGQGYLKIQIDNKLGVIHKGGWSVLPPIYQDILLLNGKLIAFKTQGLWGIASMTGRELLAPQFTSVIGETPFIALEKDRWAILNIEALVEWYRQQNVALPLTYDDWELISPGKLLVMNRDKEAILNGALRVEVPLSNHRIYELDAQSWYTKTAHGTIRFYGPTLKGIPPDRYEDFQATDQFICLARSDKWELWDRSSGAPISDILYDSVSKVGNQILRLQRADLVTLIFPSGAQLSLGKNQEARFIRGADQQKGFLQVSGAKGSRTIYDLQGKKVYNTWYFDVLPLTENYFIIEKNGQKGVIDLKGKTLVKARYQTIVADDSAHLTLLQSGKFGYYDIDARRLISPRYESRLVVIQDQILMTSKGGKKGLIDARNRAILAFEYDEIQAWSDSMVVARQGAEYGLYNFYEKEWMLEGLQQFQWINNGGHKYGIFKKQGAYGVLDNLNNLSLPQEFYDVVNVGSESQPVFLTEKRLPGNQFEVHYYNGELQLIRAVQLNEREYEKSFCF